eukprot:SAG11_NODE_7237_length_1172_cov_1.439070_3_plen_64_part_01
MLFPRVAARLPVFLVTLVVLRPLTKSYRVSQLNKPFSIHLYRVVAVDFFVLFFFFLGGGGGGGG